MPVDRTLAIYKQNLPVHKMNENRRCFCKETLMIVALTEEKTILKLINDEIYFLY